MKTKARLFAVALSLALTSASSFATGKGCLAGAAVGGVGGHFAGRHGLIGAAAGCAVGHVVSERRRQTTAYHPGRSGHAHSRRHHGHQQV